MAAPNDAFRDALIACLAERFNRLPGQCGGHADSLIAGPLAGLIASVADADAIAVRMDALEEALEASVYLAGRYRSCWLRTPVRDLGEAEAANEHAMSSLAALPERKEKGRP